MAAAIILALSACAQAGPAPDAVAFAPEYQGIEARTLGRGLVQVEVGMRGARDEADAAATEAMRRTMDEIVLWGSMSEKDRRAIMAQLRERRVP